MFTIDVMQKTIKFNDAAIVFIKGIYNSFIYIYIYIYICNYNYIIIIYI